MQYHIISSHFILSPFISYHLMPHYVTSSTATPISSIHHRNCPPMSHPFHMSLSSVMFPHYSYFPLHSGGQCGVMINHRTAHHGMPLTSTSNPGHTAPTLHPSSFSFTPLFFPSLLTKTVRLFDCQSLLSSQQLLINHFLSTVNPVHQDDAEYLRE